MIHEVDAYFSEGCGRCSHWKTPECKVHKWPAELKELRRIILECGLKEEAKWGVPCYTHKGNNIVILSAFKEYCSLNFFKGSLLHDEVKILTKPGENTQAGRQIRFTATQKIYDLETTIKAYIFEAIEVEMAGLKVETDKNKILEIPKELKEKMNEIPVLKSAFEALTPGRKREYFFHFTSAKQSKTRYARIEKCIVNILEGKGLNDHYKSTKK